MMRQCGSAGLVWSSRTSSCDTGSTKEGERGFWRRDGEGGVGAGETRRVVVVAGVSTGWRVVREMVAFI